MAKKVTTTDIRIMNDLYYKYHTYAEVARQTGWSASTIKRYIVDGYKPQSEIQLIRFTEDMIPEKSTIYFNNLKNFGELCELSDNERDEVSELWEELSI